MKDELLFLLGKNIRSVRLKRGYSQEKLSELTGLHRTYIGGIERGERNIGIRNLVVISRALEISIQDLVRGIDDITI